MVTYVWKQHLRTLFTNYGILCLTNSHREKIWCNKRNMSLTWDNWPELKYYCYLKNLYISCAPLSLHQNYTHQTNLVIREIAPNYTHWSNLVIRATAPKLYSLVF